ncbi:hypothetical protein Adt_39049 [Abeliophyllum distichum]|uniref:C2H2-type domain-containing protein n=1 Tax=Abeliophyllum distichum TaxID=126358 RepID=A0ABD1Q3Y9_9LAMI
MWVTEGSYRHGSDGAGDPPPSATPTGSIRPASLPNENNAKYFTHLVENQVRFTMPPCYPSWKDVPDEQQTQLCSIIEDDRSPDEYRVVCATIDCLAAYRYLDYKLKVHNHLKEHGSSCPYDEMSVEE